MGAAEVISFEEVRARRQWAILRQRLHERFDRWLDALERHLTAPQPTLAEITHVVWDLRQSLTGSVTEALIQHTYAHADDQPYAYCPQCARPIKTHGQVSRTLATLVGAVQVSRAYFYCVLCQYLGQITKS